MTAGMLGGMSGAFFEGSVLEWLVESVALEKENKDMLEKFDVKIWSALFAIVVARYVFREINTDTVLPYFACFAHNHQP